jgi:hypothetical protein
MRNPRSYKSAAERVALPTRIRERTRNPKRISEESKRDSRSAVERGESLLRTHLRNGDRGWNQGQAMLPCAAISGLRPE